MLDIYTVLDFTDERGELGPMLLGDLGADVIRVEAPSGTAARQAPPFVKGAGSDTGSLQFAAFNRNKRSIVLDPDSASDRATLEALVRRADFLFTSGTSREAAGRCAFGLSFQAASRLNPRIVHTQVSPFGEDGPHADLLGNDLVIAAMGGPVALQGIPERPPVRMSIPQVWRHAGAEAAVGALAAHRRMLKTGEAQFVDVSAQCAMTWTMLNAMDAHAVQGYDFKRAGSFMSNMANPIELVHPASDGYIVALPMSKAIVGCMDWMIADGVIDESWREFDWEEYDLNIRDPDAQPISLKEGNQALEAFLARHAKSELYRYGVERGVALAPVNTLQELLDLDHVKSRGYWHTITLADGSEVRSPGAWCKPSLPAMSIRRPAPGLDEHGKEIRAELASAEPKRPAAEQDHSTQTTQSAKSDMQDTASALPFDGVTVADFSWVGVGPISAKYLADHGATVTRVESANRPDVLRGGVPMKGEPDINHSQFFGDFNTSKRSLALDMKSPRAIELAKKLVARSDVMIESFAPGVIARMGLGYEEIRELNPGIIMVSTCLMGQTGPAAGLAGYGYHAAAIAGFYELTGYPDHAPSGPWVAYTDTIAPRFISILLAAALDHRRRTGEGCYIDVAQMETALHFMAPELMDAQLNGTAYTRMGNRSRTAAPQGCYPCAGDDNWCAIAVDTDEQWLALAQQVGLDGGSMPTNRDRMASHDKIDAAISSWTRQRSPEEAMGLLQQAGVPAGVVQRSSDLLRDRQYEHRRFYRRHRHGAMGDVPYAGHQYRISCYDNGPRGPAPMLGEHSFEVLSELGLSDEEIAQAYATGVVN